MKGRMCLTTMGFLSSRQFLANIRPLLLFLKWKNKGHILHFFLPPEEESRDVPVLFLSAALLVR